MKSYIIPITTLHALDFSMPLLYSTYNEEPDPGEGQFANHSLFDEEEEEVVRKSYYIPPCWDD